jgi:hypothetical protein
VARLSAVLVLLAAFVVPAHAAAPPFTPKAIAGTWTGTWTNLAYGSEGTAKIVAKSLAKNSKLVFTPDVGGDVFGCADSAGGPTKTLRKGKGANRWNAGGFRIKGTSTALGALSLVYVHKTKTLKGSGVNPACAAGLAWRLEGQFSGRAFTGVVHVYLPDGTHAESLLTLVRA